jgi:DNA-binding NarL/FixJ family response regulator
MDFILLDLVLPDASGLETIGKINEVDSKTPLVVLTGFYDETLKAQALEKGANFFVSKDRSDVNALVKALRDYVEFQRMGI